MKFFLLHSKNYSDRWILHIPAKGVAGGGVLYDYHRMQYFYSFQRAVEYMNYLTKPRDYDWKTIHK